jgi:cell division protein FtsL
MKLNADRNVWKVGVLAIVFAGVLAGLGWVCVDYYKTRQTFSYLSQVIAADDKKNPVTRAQVLDLMIQERLTKAAQPALPVPSPVPPPGKK